MIKPSPDATPQQEIILADLLKKSRKVFPASRYAYLDDYTPEIAHLQAETGAAFMDVYCPGWVHTMDVSRLDLGRPDACVVGQQAHYLTRGQVEPNRLYSYGDSLNHLISQGDSDLWAVRRGFQIPDSCSNLSPGEMYIMLTIAWKEQIRKRL